MFDIKTKGKGAKREKFKLRHLMRNRLDTRLKHRPITAGVLNYETLAKQLPVKDQGSSGSCGGQAFSGALEVAKLIRDGSPVQLSAKDIYSHCFTPPEGSDEGTLINFVESHGVALESDIPSYLPDGTCTELFMETIQTRTDQQDTTALDQIVITSYTFDGNDINQVKKAIDTGVTVCALEGNNACWQTNPVEVPDLTQLSWGHWLFLVSYSDATQTVRAKNSWGIEAGNQGYYDIPYEYFSDNRVYGEWVLVMGAKGEYIGILEQMINVYKNIIDLIKK